MSTLQERIAGERRRLRSVRQKLSAAVEQTAGGNAEWASFYEAVGDYMEAAMARLHAQDVKMGDMIRDKVERVDEKVQKALDELDERLSGNQRRLDELLAARDELQERGTQAIERFESAAREFTDFIVRNMGHHGATTELAGKLFKPADWEYMAGITDEAMAHEVALYERVETTTPADLEVPAAD
jgi:TolA-binding protein